jgi:hypothetical protein
MSRAWSRSSIALTGGAGVAAHPTHAGAGHPRIRPIRAAWFRSPAVSLPRRASAPTACGFPTRRDRLAAWRVMLHAGSGTARRSPRLESRSLPPCGRGFAHPPSFGAGVRRSFPWRCFPARRARLRPCRRHAAVRRAHRPDLPCAGLSDSSRLAAARSRLCLEIAASSCPWPCSRSDVSLFLLLRFVGQSAVPAGLS